MNTLDRGLEIRKKVLPQVVVLDLDRTLVDPRVVMERFYAIAGRYGADVGKIREAQRSVEGAGESFDPLHYIQRDKIDEFANAFLSHESDPLLYRDAALFLQELEDNHIAHLVLTYGVNIAWQRLKVTASGYGGDVIVLDRKGKGKILAGWWKEDGEVFDVIGAQGQELYRAKSLCLIDDKASEFKGLPAGCTGFWLQRNTVLLSSQRGTVKKEVEVIRGLSDLEVSTGMLRRKKHVSEV